MCVDGSSHNEPKCTKNRISNGNAGGSLSMKLTVSTRNRTQSMRLRL